MAEGLAVGLSEDMICTALRAGGRGEGDQIVACPCLCCCCCCCGGGLVGEKGGEWGPRKGRVERRLLRLGGKGSCCCGDDRGAGAREVLD